ncbi:PorT family protein [Polaribacter batillariae]|uniref:PorT family protein n=1 Tax=Polaribacter batillariae TaxID=2808900 RepID=A0ABX7T243_9FLAO|nr:porin family protein [Polaribacter batillariae]QTD39044.1 PorT family protein [Polaribacter batillariae]
MKHISFTFFLLFCTINLQAQKDSLQLGDRYAEDQIYASISYSQLNDQPTLIPKSSFSYSLSTGFIKDFILNKSGSISFAAGIGYGYDFFNHELKVEEINGNTSFSRDNTINSNFYKSHNIEFPLEFRWRTSTANKYSFWRIYTGIKFLYNASNSFQFEAANNKQFKYNNVAAYNKLQYGLTISAGYDEFNVNVFYGLSPVFKNAFINGESVNTKVLKFGLIFYLL